MNPQGIGFDANVDPEFHPVICVGAINDEAYNNDKFRIKASYSNNGPKLMSGHQQMKLYLQELMELLLMKISKDMMIIDFMIVVSMELLLLHQ